MPYYVYILKCADKTLYAGSTNNLPNRIKKHNQGKGSKYTRARLPVKLVYYDKYNTLKLARQREYQIKGWRKEKKLNLIRYGHPTSKINNY